MLGMFSEKKEHVGIAAMICNAVITTFQMVFGRVVNDLEWPFWRIMLGSNALMVLAFGVISIATGAHAPEASQRKWVVLRAVSSSLSFVSCIVAVQLSAAPGDVTALASVNVVFAAFMGHLFLAEKLRVVHVFIVSCSVVGAVLVSQPAFVFGGESGSWLGCNLALFSGLARAASFVCARKSVGVPVPLLSCVTATLGLPFIVLLPITPLIAEPPFGRELAEPLAAVGLVLATFLSGLAAISTGTLGSLLCPAAVSATVVTGAGMILGYLAQCLLFNTAPGWLTLAGAALMLFAVAASAAVRSPQQPTVEASTMPSATEDVTRIPSVEEDETESLASFVASEFSTESPHNEPLRRRGQLSKLASVQIGAASVVAAVAVAAV